MIKLVTKVGLSLSFLALAMQAGAQMPATMMNADTTAEFRPSGKLWGYAFGDYANKGGSDELNRGGSNQYTGVPINTNMFQWRRIYLGYNYEISQKFSAEFLLAAEDDFAAGVLGQGANATSTNVKVTGNQTGTTTTAGTLALGGNGDVLLNNKFSPYIKLANLRWKNIFKGTDLVIGQAATPSFPMMSESIWSYRSIERTVSDIRRTPSFDMGATLQGKYGKDGTCGYDLMVGNGQSAKPENDPYKWFYGDVWVKLANKKLVIDLYQDYQKLHWTYMHDGNPETAVTTTNTTTGVVTTTYSLPGAASLHHDRNMTKLFVAWNDKKFTIGFEGFMNTIMGDLQVVGKDNKVYYKTSTATDLSFFVRGKIYKEKLSFFARYDMYDPSGMLKSDISDKFVVSYKALTSQYEPTTKENFVTFGLDFTPVKNVHIMPNVWINSYESALSATGTNDAGLLYTKMNGNVNATKGTDAVYRLTFYYIYGK